MLYFAKKWYVSTTKTIFNIYGLASITVTKFFFFFFKEKEGQGVKINFGGMFYSMLYWTCKIILCAIKAGHIVIQALIRLVLTDLVF